MNNEWSVIWSPEARNDLRAIVRRVAADRPATAEEVLERLLRRAESLRSFPNRGRVVPEHIPTHEVPLREVIEDPWRIMYLANTERVLVVAVLDGRRDVGTVLNERLQPGSPTSN